MQHSFFKSWFCCLTNLQKYALCQQQPAKSNLARKLLSGSVPDSVCFGDTYCLQGQGCVLIVKHLTLLLSQALSGTHFHVQIQLTPKYLFHQVSDHVKMFLKSFYFRCSVLKTEAEILLTSSTKRLKTVNNLIWILFYEM